jgi:cation diffusion facilitator CzcD-associated flavoprotein CzcO
MYHYQNQGPMGSNFPANGTHFDTIVVGGGIAGVTAAVELSKLGENVAVL